MRNKYIASVLALSLGVLGVHRFYLNQRFWGVLYILFFPISAIISLIDAILFLTSDQQEFDYRYNKRFFSDIYDITPYEYVKNKKIGVRDSFLELQKVHKSDFQKNPRHLKSQKVEKKLIRAKKLLNLYDIDTAINLYSEILTIDPNEKYAHFYLACCYSLLESKRNTLYHLVESIDLGIDQNLIEETDELAFIRLSKEYQELSQVEFPNLSKKEPHLEIPEKTIEDIFITKREDKALSTNSDIDFLATLERLAQLRKDGILTNEEFQEQKKRLLNQ